MTKQEAVCKAKALLEHLEALPDGIGVLTADIRDASSEAYTQIQLGNGIEAVGKALGMSFQDETSNNGDCVFRYVRSKNCEYVQVVDDIAGRENGT